MRCLPAAALLAAAPGAHAVLPCASSGQTYTVCPAKWEWLGPATYVGDSVQQKEGGVGGAEDDDDDNDDQAFGPARIAERAARDDDGDDSDDARRRRGGAHTRGGLRIVRDSLASSSAVQVAASGKPGVWFSGTVNGGVWRTKDVYAEPRMWEPVLDGQPVSCSAIAAVEVASFDADFVLAGCGGSTSSEMGRNPVMVNTGDWGGVMVSRDGGDTWAMTGFPANYYVTGIAAVSKDLLVVSARAHYFNISDGGVWTSSDGGATWDRVLSRPTFSLLYVAAADALVAAHPRDISDGASGRHVSVARNVSAGGGADWGDWSGGVDWHGREAFYPTLAATAGASPTIFVGALTVPVSNNWQDTSSATFWRALDGKAEWAEIANQPAIMDQDKMPKDRMGLLADPEHDDLLYIVGNAGSVAWRIEYQTGSWTRLWGAESGSPHSDCRSIAWEPTKGQLVVTSDGGIFARSSPRGSGVWTSWNGGSGAMEFVTAAWDYKNSRWIGGAQDNGVQYSPKNATAGQVALYKGVGDGTLTEVDNAAHPVRLFGAGYLYGGLFFKQGSKSYSIPASSWFPGEAAVSYFVHPWTLNTQDPTRLVLWVNGTGGGASGWWEVALPYSVSSSSDIKKPSKILAETPGAVTTFVAGGVTAGKSDPSVLIGMNGRYLYHRSAASQGKVVARKLPVKYAEPVIWTKYHSSCSFKIRGACVGPISHGKPQFLAVSPADSAVVAVTGWTEIEHNKEGSDSVWLSRDAGATWADVTGDLVAASATVGLARPSGIIVVDFPDRNASALVAGTVNGVFASWTDAPGKWARVGGCGGGIPKVLVVGLSYEANSDTLLAATFGRGIYLLKAAKAVLATSRAQQEKGSCA